MMRLKHYNVLCGLMQKHRCTTLTRLTLHARVARDTSTRVWIHCIGAWATIPTWRTGTLVYV